MKSGRLTVIGLAIILLAAACRPELVDEDGPLEVNKFRLEPELDTIVEGNYTQPPCLIDLDSNYISFNIHTSDIQRIEVEEEEFYPVKIKVFANYASPSMILEVLLPPDTLPMVRRNYEISGNDNPKSGKAYLYLEYNGFELDRYESVNSGTVHFYRKDKNSFRIQICDALMREIGSSSSFKIDFTGWIEN